VERAKNLGSALIVEAVGSLGAREDWQETRECQWNL
jgi:hypothetical protein